MGGGARVLPPPLFFYFFKKNRGAFGASAGRTRPAGLGYAVLLNLNVATQYSVEPLALLFKAFAIASAVLKSS